MIRCLTVRQEPSPHQERRMENNMNMSPGEVEMLLDELAIRFILNTLGRGSGPTRDVSRKELTMHLQQCIVDTRKCVNNAL